MFCRLGSDDDSRPVVRGGERVAGVDPVGVRIDEGRQRVRIGRLELGHLPPFEDFLRQGVALLGEIVEHRGRGRPGAGLGLLAARQAHLAEQDVAELLGRARIDRLAGKLPDLGLEPHGLLGEIARQPRQHLAVDRNAAPLHAGEHRDQRPLQGLVDRHHVLGDEAGFEHLPQPQRHVGILGGVFGRLVDRHIGEADMALAGAGDLAVVDGAVVEQLLRQRVHPVGAAAGIEHIGHQHGVVDRRDLDAVAGQHQPVEFQVLPDLEDAAILQQRLEHARARPRP